MPGLYPTCSSKMILIPEFLTSPTFPGIHFLFTLHPKYAQGGQEPPHPCSQPLAGNGALLPGQDWGLHTHSPTGSPFPVSCWSLCLQLTGIPDKRVLLGCTLFCFFKQGRRKEMFIITNRLHLLHHSVNQAHLNRTAGYLCSINITPQFTEKVSLVGIDNYTLHKHKQKL